jgi:hypothetical protein
MTEDHDLVDGLKAHYGAAARKAAGGDVVVEDGCGADGCCGPEVRDSTETLGAALYDTADLDALPLAAVAGASAAPTRSRWPGWNPARTCSTSDREAGSTCCSPLAGSARRGGRTAST